MRTIELFCGTKSFSKVMAQQGHKTFTVDNNPIHEPDSCESISEINPFVHRNIYDLLWASPPCTTFSVASIGTHWTGGKKKYLPKTASAQNGLDVLFTTIKFIQITQPKRWYIENPRGVMRKVIDDIFKNNGIENYRRVTITYCQYGDTRMKPTDIWTNDFNWKPRPPCKNGDKCHVAAPRGSKTGTQGLKNATDRGVIPPQLFEEILEAIK